MIGPTWCGERGGGRGVGEEERCGRGRWRGVGDINARERKGVREMREGRGVHGEGRERGEWEGRGGRGRGEEGEVGERRERGGEGEGVGMMGVLREAWRMW